MAPSLIAALQLAPDEADVVDKCMRAVVDGTFIEDWEFGSVMGLDRDETRTVLRSWRDAAMSEGNFAVLNNSLNNLCRYPHRMDEAVVRLTGLNRTEIANLLDRLRHRVIDGNLDAHWQVPLNRDDMP